MCSIISDPYKKLVPPYIPILFILRMAMDPIWIKSIKIHTYPIKKIFHLVPIPRFESGILSSMNPSLLPKWKEEDIGCGGEGEYLDGEEDDVGCSGLDALFIAGEDAIKDVGDGDKEAEDGGDQDVGGEDGVAEAEDWGSWIREEGGRR